MSSGGADEGRIQRWFELRTLISEHSAVATLLCGVLVLVAFAVVNSYETLIWCSVNAWLIVKMDCFVGVI